MSDIANEQKRKTDTESDKGRGDEIRESNEHTLEIFFCSQKLSLLPV